jgi:hypothetical protein
MKKIWSKIIPVLVMFSIFLAPISINIEKKYDRLTLTTKVKQVEAFRFWGTTDADAEGDTQTDYSLKCASWSGIDLGGCVATLLYFFWTITAWIAYAAGGFLDFFIYYSVNSSSYSGSFVETGWGIIRDIANIFFIIALIYVAIKTVLSLSIANNKKLVGWIIIMALLINFSLFVTKAVIDSSNILAKIFYNNITPVGKNGETLDPSDGGEKSISLGLISSYNPQKIITRDVYKTEGAGIFSFVTIILMFVTLYTAYVFFAVAILFLARVVSLWMAMIFSPLAFASYTLDIDIPGFGHRKWWTELFKNAFLAPVFIFFLYIIILFLKIEGKIFYSDSSNTPMQTIMSVVVSFSIVMALLMKAKKLAVEYSGEMGQAMTKGGKILGGLAIGAATGGAALLGSRVIGGAAAKRLSSSGERLREKAKEKGFSGYAARLQLKALDYGTKASFDARKTKAGTALGGVSGMNFQSANLIGLGSKEGGYKGAGDRAFAKLKEKSELYKTNMSDKEVKAWSQERTLKYRKELTDARKNGTEKEYKKKYGENPPKEYTKASELNKDRMEAYKDNLGQSGLLGALSYHIAKSSVGLMDKESFEKSKKGGVMNEKYKKLYRDKKEKEAYAESREKGVAFNQGAFNAKYRGTEKNIEYDESIAKEVNNDLIKKVKMGIAGAAIGGIAGGAIGAIAGGAIGAGVGKGFVDEAGESKMAQMIAKENKELGKIGVKLEDLVNTLKKQNDFKNKARTLKINNEDLFTNNKVDSEKIDKASAYLKFSSEDLSNRLKVVNEKIAKAKEDGTNTLFFDTEKIKIQKEMIDTTIKTSQVKDLRDIEEKIANTDKRIYDLTGQKAKLGNKEEEK